MLVQGEEFLEISCLLVQELSAARRLRRGSWGNPGTSCSTSLVVCGRHVCVWVHEGSWGIPGTSRFAPAAARGLRRRLGERRGSWGNPGTSCEPVGSVCEQLCVGEVGQRGVSPIYVHVRVRHIGERGTHRFQRRYSVLLVFSILVREACVRVRAPELCLGHVQLHAAALDDLFPLYEAWEEAIWGSN